MGKSKKKHEKKHKEKDLPIEELIKEVEPETVEDDTDLEEIPKRTSKSKSICKLILRFLGSNFGLFLVLV